MNIHQFLSPCVAMHAVVYFFDSMIYLTTADTEKHSALYRRARCGLFSKKIIEHG
jgi:hypothetical protein